MKRYFFGLAALVVALGFAGSASALDFIRPAYPNGGFNGPTYPGNGYRSYAPNYGNYVPDQYDRHRGHVDYIPPHVDNRQWQPRTPAPYFPGSGYHPPRHHRD